MPSSTPVTDVMTKDVVTLAPDTSLADAADLLAEKGFGAAPVVDADGKIVGLLRDEDLLISEARLHLPTTIAILPGIEFTLPSSLRRYDEELKKAASSTVADVMEKSFKHVAPGRGRRRCRDDDARARRHPRPGRRQDEKVVGIVARGDIVRYLASTT